MTLKGAVIGLGGIADKGYLPVLSTWKGLELIFHTRNAEKLKDLAEQHRISKSTTSLDEVIELKPDFAFVLTPFQTHYDLCKRLLEAGIDVFVEKPATESAEKTRQLAQLADEQRRILMVAFNRRYAPLAVRGWRTWHDRPISLAIFEKHRDKPHFDNLYDYVTEEMIHIIDLVRYFCGDAKAVRTVYKEEGGKLISVNSLLALEEGGTAIVSGTMLAGAWQERYTLHGGNTSLVIDAFSELRLYSEGVEKSWKEPYPSSWQSNLKGRGFVDQIEHFLECVVNHQVPMTSAWDSAKTQALVEDIIAKA